MALDRLLPEILTNIAVDILSPEIRDITSALEELLKRFFDSLGRRYSKFKVSNIQQCGSMAEGTALWKSVTRSNGRESKFIEYDYIAVMENSDNLLRMRGTCRGCKDIYSHLNRQTYSYLEFEAEFLSRLYSTITSLCSCHNANSEPVRSQSVERTTPRSCEYCKTVRNTGSLRLAAPGAAYRTVKDCEHCSLVFYWDSNTSCLLAPDIDTLRLTEKMSRLVIRVDLLPAIAIHGHQS